MREEVNDLELRTKTVGRLVNLKMNVDDFESQIIDKASKRDIYKIMIKLDHLS